jgi:hypothetical protein
MSRVDIAHEIEHDLAAITRTWLDRALVSPPLCWIYPCSWLTLNSYITYVFGMAGLSGNTNLVASSIQYVINVFMTIFALFYIDVWGRRMPLLIGGTFMAIWMYANAGLMASYGKPAPPGGVDHVPEESWQISGAPAKAVIACTYLFVASFAPTWG